MISSKNIIPNMYVSSIYDIDYNKLYANNKRLILIDLDNTLISYKENDVNERIINWKKELQEIGFEIIIVSNSKKKRVSYFADNLGVDYVSFATKPFKRGIKKAIRNAVNKYDRKQIVLIGDQLMTDVNVASRVGITPILVKAIDKKTEFWATRLNRKIEKFLISRVKKRNIELYNNTLKEYVGDNFEA